MTKKSNNSILAFQKTVRFRYFYRGLCTLILTAFALAMFLVIWIDYVKDNNHTGFLSGIGNIGLASIIYVVLFLMNGRFLKAFQIGVERKAKHIASIILTCWFTDFIEILVSITILNNFRFVFAFAWRYVLLALCQSVVLMFTVALMVNIYRKLVKPLPVVMIYGNYENDIERKIMESLRNIMLKRKFIMMILILT